MTTDAGNATRFVTVTGIEVPAITADEMREIDRIAIEETGPNIYQMMENAGRSLALLAIELLGKSWEKSRIVILAGGGGNGGGGICAARHLANHRLDVRLCLADTRRLGEVTSFQRKIFASTAAKEIQVSALPECRADFIVDAITGYGLRSGLQGTAAELVEWANQAHTPILALDVPSGLNSTTGESPGESIKADWTMTLALPKTGLLSDKAGELFMADLGIPEMSYRRAGLKYIPPFGDRFWTRLMRHQNYEFT